MNRERSLKSVADLFLYGQRPSHNPLPDVRILYGMCSEIRILSCVDVFYGYVRLPNTFGGNR
jgi:hypothetical protein